MNESKLAQRLEEIAREQNADYDTKDKFAYEVPYNNYGSRGVVDYVHKTYYPDQSGASLLLAELKSEYAVEQATGANEILRQFNKMARSFTADPSNADWVENVDMVYYQLLFEPSPRCVDHVVDNLTMYESVDFSPSKDVTQHVGFVNSIADAEGAVGLVNARSLVFGGDGFESILSHDPEIEAAFNSSEKYAELREARQGMNGWDDE